MSDALQKNDVGLVFSVECTYAFAIGIHRVLPRETFAFRFQIGFLLLRRFQFLLGIEQRGENDQTENAAVVLFDAGEKSSTFAVQSDVLRTHQIFFHHDQTRDERFENNIQNKSIDPFRSNAQMRIAEIIRITLFQTRISFCRN